MGEACSNSPTLTNNRTVMRCSQPASAYQAGGLWKPVRASVTQCLASR
jgi:hypothetical protein